MTQVAFVVHPEKPEAVQLLGQLAAHVHQLGGRSVVGEEALGGGAVPLVDPATRIEALPEADLAEGSDLMVSVGGDGTLLRAASVLGERKTPVLGINSGRLGFLTAADAKGATQALDDALHGRLPIENRMRLRVTLTRSSGESLSRLALNDAVVSHGEVARLLELQCNLDNHPVALYQADGLIIATPTGSTAYNLAAGGPILTPGHQGFALTPVCPHTLTNRPLVLPQTSTVEVHLAGRSEHALLAVDGQWAIGVEAGDVITVRQSKEALRLFHSETPFFEILRAKLAWGETPQGR